jgi:hypothetical protein
MLAMSITREQQTGSSKARMENYTESLSLVDTRETRTFLPSAALHRTNLYLQSGLWKEYFVVRKFSSLIPQTG